MNGFLEPVRLHPRPEGLWLPGLIMVAAALMAVAVTALALSTKALVAAGVLVTVATDWRIRRSGCGRAVRAILLGADGQWRIASVPGVWIDVRLVRCWGAALGPVIALQWIDGERRAYRACLLKGEVSAQVWRRLRVRLRLA